MSGIDSRRDLLYALSEAAEIEHALCCQYLFAAYSLKKHPEEGNVTWPQLKRIRDWQSDILVVARQEMEHLGTVCNLLTAVGGAPHFQRPNFPQPSRYFGEMAAFRLERFSAETIRRFVEFEKPEFLHLRAAIHRAIEREHRDLRSALAIVLRKICTDASWGYGEAWIPRPASAPLELAATWFPDQPARTASLRAPRARPGQRAPEERFTPGRDLAGRAWSSGKPERIALDAASLEAGLNTAAAIPFVAGDRTLAVLVFFYRTFSSIEEDDALVDMVDRVLHGREEASGEANPLALRLEQILTQRAPALFLALPPLPRDVLLPPRLDFSTIGGFYRQIRKGFLQLAYDYGGEDRLFIGPPAAQISYKEIGLPFPDWHNVDPVPVTNLKTALTAIDEIIIEGEGTPEASEASHYGRFRSILRELEAELKADSTFEPARPVVSNPLTREHSDTRLRTFLFSTAAKAADGLDRGQLSNRLRSAFRRQGDISLSHEVSVKVQLAGAAWLITDEQGTQVYAARKTDRELAVFETVALLEPADTVAVAELFNAAYEMLLLLLIRLYAHSGETEGELKALAGVAFLPLMTQVLRPLAEILTRMPAREGEPALAAGPSFEVYRDLHLLPHKAASWRLFHERLQEIADACGLLARRPGASPRLSLLHQNLARLAGNLEHHQRPMKEA